MKKTVSALALVAVALSGMAAAAPASAAKTKEEVALTKCETSLGSIAVVHVAAGSGGQRSGRGGGRPEAHPEAQRDSRDQVVVG